MPLYLDASVSVAIVRNEPTRPLFEWLVAPGCDALLMSDFGVAETSAALVARGRASNRSRSLIEADLEHFDRWTADFTDLVTTATADVIAATAMVRRRDLILRAPDAIHIACAHRLDATLVTLDIGMARAARALGVPCINPAEAVGGPKD